MYHVCLNWYTVCTIASNSIDWLCCFYLVTHWDRVGLVNLELRGKTLVGVHPSREQVEEHLKQFKIQSSDVGDTWKIGQTLNEER